MHWTEPATADDSHAAFEKNGAEQHRQPTRAALRGRAGAQIKLWDAAYIFCGEWSGATWTLPMERPKGGRGGDHQFYTPTSIVKLIVEILEPYHGRILDPACGSGGMFIQSARFVEEHRKNPTTDISVHGQDQWAWGADLRRAQRARRVRQRRKLPNQRVTDNSRLARLYLAVHGLSGDIKQGNTHYEDLQDSVGRFDFVLALPSETAPLTKRSRFTNRSARINPLFSQPRRSGLISHQTYYATFSTNTEI